MCHNFIIVNISCNATFTTVVKYCQISTGLKDIILFCYIVFRLEAVLTVLHIPLTAN